LWLKVLLKLRFQEFIQKIAFLGKDEIYFWKRHCAEHGMNWKKLIDYKHALNRGIKNVDSIVLAPRGLEFPSFSAPKKLTFYDHSHLKNETKFFSPEYQALKKQLKNQNKTVIYLAFGTLAMGNAHIEVFFNDVLSIVDEYTDTLLIVSKGKVPMNLNASKNSIVFEFVPQQDVLSFADLFITHGGLGSVKEAYYAQVPMLVVPFNNKTDMAGNAARIKAKGLGEYLDLENYSKKELAKKLALLIQAKKNNHRVYSTAESLPQLS